MAGQLIHLDKSEHLVLVLCHACPAWREAATDEAQAYRLGQIHAVFVHSDDKLAADLRARVVRLKKQRT